MAHLPLLRLLAACLAILHCHKALAQDDTITAPANRARTFYAVNADPLWDFNAAAGPASELPLFLAMLKKSQAGAVRIPVRWQVLEPKQGEWNFARMDEIMQSIPADVQVLGVLMSIPAWANGQDPEKAVGWFDAYPPKDLENWSQAVEKIVDRYKDRVSHWEIWNEQNGIDFYRPRPDAKEYTELLKRAYTAAKKADPRCTVVLGGLQMNGILANPWSDVKVENYLEDLYKAGAKPYFDICNIHPYVLPAEGAAQMMKLTRDTLALMNRYGDGAKSLWLTEVGCGAVNAQERKAQAELLRDTMELAARERRIGRVFWFTLRDKERELLGPESSMGMFTFAGEAKPALDAFTGAAARAGGETGVTDRINQVQDSPSQRSCTP